MDTEQSNQDNMENAGQESVHPEQEHASGEGAAGENAASNNAASEKPSAENATAAERVVNVAKEQASEAAEAIRKGEFMHNTYVDEDASSDDRLIAMLSYASQIFLPLVMPVIVLISENSKRHPFQRYHAVQSLALVVVMLAIGLGAFVGLAILSAIPLIGTIFSIFWLLLCCLTPLIFLMAVTSLGFYGFQAYQGKRFSIPGLTSFLMDQGWIK